MSIDTKTAAKIAKERGLDLSDARSLAAMAESEEDAIELADLFADPNPAPKPNPYQKVFDEHQI